MISDEQLDAYRIDGTQLRVVRDADPANDVKGIVVAWDSDVIMIRKANRRLVKLDRRYLYIPFAQERPAHVSFMPEGRS